MEQEKSDQVDEELDLVEEEIEEVVTNEEESEEEDSEDEADRFQIIVAIMIAIVSLVGAAVGWQSTLIEDDDADRSGLEAALNVETTRFINTAELFRHYRAYTSYTLNEELAEQLEEELLLASDVDASSEALFLQQSAAEDIVGTSQQFFPPRYLNRDGSYNTQRELGEAWAQAEQLMDLDPQAHFDEADSQRAKSSLIITNLVILTVSLLFFTIAEGLHAKRLALRRFTAGAGTFFLVISVIAAFGVERIF